MSTTDSVLSEAKHTCIEYSFSATTLAARTSPRTKTITRAPEVSKPSVANSEFASLRFSSPGEFEQIAVHLWE
jgi:hypothetical protein